MWAEATKWLNKFDEAVLTVVDIDGYPASVRVDSHAYDPNTGELRATIPDALNAAEGPANLLCHYHDEKMWNINMVAIRGHVRSRDGAWVFTSTSFDPPSRLAFLSFVKGARMSAQKYLDKRELMRPHVNWAAIKEIGTRARAENR